MRQRTQGKIGGETTPSSDVVIQVQNLAKSYGGTRALTNVSFSLRVGEILAYLGPNGAGKTTTINILCGLLDRDGGQAHICGVDIAEDPVAVKQQIGVVPEESNLYPELTCRRNLEYVGELFGLSHAVRRTRAEALLETFELSDRGDVPFRTLSRGLKRRLTVAAALVHSPEIVFLDEPTTGLDVPSARALRSLIHSINRDGTTVFLSTHNLAEAEALSHRVLILVKGRVVAEGSATEIRQRVEKAKTLSAVLSGEVAKSALLQECPAIQSAATAEGAWRFEVSEPHAAVAQLVPFADRHGVRILEIVTTTPSLEDAFMAILQDDSHHKEVGE